jgi:hypothetical protein
LFDLEIPQNIEAIDAVAAAEVTVSWPEVP